MDSLNSSLYLFSQAPLYDGIDLFVIHGNSGLFILSQYILCDGLPADINEFGEVSQRNRLAAVLVRGNLSNDLGGDIARSGKAMRLFNHRAGDNGAVLEHIIQIHEVAIVHMLSEVVRVMEVNEPFIMSVHDVGRQQHAPSHITRNFPSNIITLRRQDIYIFIGVLLASFHACSVHNGGDLVVDWTRFPLELMLIAVRHIVIGETVCSVPHNLHDDLVLHRFHSWQSLCIEEVILNVLGDSANVGITQTFGF